MNMKTYSQSQKKAGKIPSEAEIGLAAKSCQTLLELDNLFEAGLTAERLQERRRDIVQKLNALISVSTDGDAIETYRKTIAMLRARMEFSDMRESSGSRSMN